MKSVTATCCLCKGQIVFNLPPLVLEAFGPYLDHPEQLCNKCFQQKLGKIHEVPHPEIPEGPYCYGRDSEGKRGDCPHWQGTEKGARCNLLEINSLQYDPFNLVWDRCKICGVNDHDEVD